MTFSHVLISYLPIPTLKQRPQCAMSIDLPLVFFGLKDTSRISIDFGRHTRQSRLLVLQHEAVQIVPML